VNVTGTGRDSAGGIILMNARGDIASTQGSLIAAGRSDSLGYSAFGGHVSLVSSLGQINLAGGVDISSQGSTAGGLLLSAAGIYGITVGGDIMATAAGAGNTAGRILISADAGPVSLQNINATGLSQAFGGTILIHSAGSVNAGSGSGALQGISVSGVG